MALSVGDAAASGTNTPTHIGETHLHVVFDEARRLHARLHVEADVHFNVGLLVRQLDDGHLRERQARGVRQTHVSKQLLLIVSVTVWWSCGPAYADHRTLRC